MQWKGNDEWVSLMAKELISEITESMANILLRDGKISEQELEQKKLVGISAAIGGDYPMTLRFFSERRFIYRLTKNMMASEPTKEDMQDYAIEYFNTICGRFVSELINQMHIKAHLMPIRYEEAFDPASEENGQTQALCLISDADEYTLFSWTEEAIREMIKRSNTK